MPIEPQETLKQMGTPYPTLDDAPDQRISSNEKIVLHIKSCQAVEVVFQADEFAELQQLAVLDETSL